LGHIGNGGDPTHEEKGEGLGKCEEWFIKKNSNLGRKRIITIKDDEEPKKDWLTYK